MENQIRFDLIDAIDKWRQELATQSGLTLGDQRELETHLRDSLAELRRIGLSDEETFWLARRRLGPPQQLSEEFLAADPRRVWRERAFWLALALLAIQLVGLTGQAFLAIGLRSIPDWVAVYTPDWWLDLWKWMSISGVPSMLVTWVLPFVIVLILMKRGGLRTGRPAIQFFICSRRRLIFLSTVAVVVLNCLYWMPMFRTPGFPFYFGVESVVRYLGLVAIVAWLMPTRVGQLAKEATTS